MCKSPVISVNGNEGRKDEEIDKMEKGMIKGGE